MQYPKKAYKDINKSHTCILVKVDIWASAAGGP